MEALQFSEIRSLLNACRLTSIEPDPIKSESGCWELYKGCYKTHVIEVPFELLYILADATSDSLRRALNTAFKPKETFVVYAPSLKLSAARRQDFASARGLWNTTEYLASFMKNELETYRRALKQLEPRYFVDPVVQVPASTNHRFPNPIALFLADPKTSAEEEGIGSVAVVLAEAGHGKTYMCEWLVARLSNSGAEILPIFVSSKQWQSLRPEDLSSLGTTIVSSFRELGAPLPWVEGQEDLFLRVALKAGLFRIVFDGFDEYVLRTPGDVSATATLAAIASLASETGARVVVTSRTSFWHAEIGPPSQDVELVGDKANVYVYQLKPFSPELAANYFRARFPDNKAKVERALSMFRDLSRDDPGFAGRGFVLLLVADLIDSGDSSGVMNASEKPLIRLMRAHCDRERTRQQLPLSADQQLEALGHFVFEVAGGEQPTSDLLTMAVQLAAPELRDEDVRSAVEKMVPHALIVGLRGRWQIRQSQVEIALLATQILQLAEAGGDTGHLLLAKFSARRLDPAYESDLAAMLASLCLWGRDQDTAFAAGRGLISTFFEASRTSVEDLRSQSLRRLSTLIAFRIVEAHSSLTHRERAQKLAALFPNPAYGGVVLFGGIARYDWSGSAFNECVFDNVRWSNCTFDAATVARNCHLLGGNAQHCHGFAEIQWVSCFTDDAGRQFRAEEAFKSGKSAYSLELLQRDIVALLEKFLGKGGIGFRTVDEADLGKGKIAVSPFKKEIVESTVRHLLDAHHISGGSKNGLHIRDDAKDAVRALFANSAWVGSVGTVLNELKQRADLA